MATYPINPNEAYYQPTEQDVQLNRDYFAGYSVVQPLNQRICPNPGDFCQYGSDAAYGVYCQAYTELKVPDTAQGYPIAMACGINAAIWDAMCWLWVNDPDSPNRTPCDSTKGPTSEPPKPRLVTSWGKRLD